jgi:hypothetical protein
VKAGNLGPREVPHNQYHAFVMMLIELSRALDTDFYRVALTPEQASYANQLSRHVLPRIIAGAQRYFRKRNHEQLCFDDSVDPKTTCMVWQFKEWENGTNLSDTGHANLDMRYIDVLFQHRSRLNSVLAASIYAPEEILLSDTDMTWLANTFVHRVSRGAHLAESLWGNAPNPIDRRDGDCDGWVTLAQFEALGLYDPGFFNDSIAPTLQPHLNPANHAALLAMKVYRAKPPNPKPPKKKWLP